MNKTAKMKVKTGSVTAQKSGLSEPEAKGNISSTEFFLI